MKRLVLTLFVVINAVFATGCSDDDPAPPPTIVISGTVTSATDSSPVETAQVTILNIETQQNELDPLYTGATGDYSFKVSPGTYEVRVAAQGFLPSPLDGLSGIPISQTETHDVGLEPITDTALYGLLNIQLVEYSNNHGALAILTNTISSQTYTAVTTNTGSLMVYNLPVGDYGLTIKTTGHETYTHATDVTINQDEATAISDITLTATDGFTVGGTVTFLAIENSEVDVSLTDRDTGAVIPGTNVNTVSTSYTINSVAPGSYYIRATFKVDGLVVDPDSIVKFGEPEVTVVAANVTDGNIDVTGAVALTSPVIQSDGAPGVIDTLTPVLTWTSYPSTTDYVVEVLDANGNVIWGGFSTDGTLTKLVTTAETSIGYSNDGLGQILEDGAVYRWKVYASKNNVQATTGWELISSSEDAQGVFTVVIP